MTSRGYRWVMRAIMGDAYLGVSLRNSGVFLLGSGLVSPKDVLGDLMWRRQIGGHG